MTEQFALMQVDSYSFGVVLWELITREHSERGNWRPVRVPEECPAEVDALLTVKRPFCTTQYYPEVVAANSQCSTALRKIRLPPLH